LHYPDGIGGGGPPRGLAGGPPTEVLHQTPGAPGARLLCGHRHKRRGGGGGQEGGRSQGPPPRPPAPPHGGGARAWGGLSRATERIRTPPSVPAPSTDTDD